MTREEALVALKEYYNLKMKLIPIQVELDFIETDIKRYVLETGDAIKTDEIETQMRNGYTRSSWDDKKLRGFAVVHPEIMQFCKETETAPSVSIRLRL